MNFTQDEIFRHVRVGHAVATIETSLNVLIEHAAILEPDLARRVIDAFEKFGESRRQLISPLARALPPSESRN